MWFAIFYFCNTQAISTRSLVVKTLSTSSIGYSSCCSLWRVTVVVSAAPAILNLSERHNVMHCFFLFFLHHRSSAIQTDKVCASIQFLKWYCWYFFYGIWQVSFHGSFTCFVLCIYSIILSFNFFGGYNHGPCGCEVGFVTLCLLL